MLAIKTAVTKIIALLLCALEIKLSFWQIILLLCGVGFSSFRFGFNTNLKLTE